MNQADKAKYRELMRPIVGPLKSYHIRQTNKKRTFTRIARGLNVSTNSYRAWLAGKVVPDLNHMHVIVAKLRESRLTPAPDILSYLRDNPPVVADKPLPKKAYKAVAAKSKKQPRKKVKRKAALSTKRDTSPIEDMIRNMVREEVQRVLDGVSVRIQT